MAASIVISSPNAVGAGQMLSVTVTYTLGGTLPMQNAPYAITWNNVAALTGVADTGAGKTFTRTFVAPAGVTTNSLDVSWGPPGAQAFASKSITTSGGILATVTMPPSLNQIIDSATYRQGAENNALVVQLEGGYAAARARNTRRPRKNWNFGFTFITDEEKILLEDFYYVVLKGNAQPFFWVDPPTGVLYTCRFKQHPEFSYRGIAFTKRWDAACQIEQV